MKQTATAEEPLNALSPRQQAALLTLLADDDPAVYTTVRERILRSGPASAEWLRPYLVSADPALRRRAHEIVLHFEKQAADNQFLAFCLQHGEDFDLETGAWLLAKSEYPDIDTHAYGGMLDGFADEINAQLRRRAPARQVLATVNGFLFGDLRFRGNVANYYDPQNSYLNRVIDRRTGIPITLCLIYYLLARRLQLPITGIGLPGRFVCRYQTSATEIYIDAFDSGAFLSKADCIQYLLQANYPIKDEFLAPVSSRKFLLRMCANLHQVYVQLDKTEEATRFQRYMVALAR